MATVPELLFVVDVRREETAIHEANLLGIPVLALVDTNCNPENVDYVIPSNDDAIRAIKLMVSKIADAVLEGKALRKDVEEEDVGVSEDLEAMAAAEVTDEDLLGEATLAKLKSGEYDERQAAADQEAEEAENAKKDEDDADEESSEEKAEAESADEDGDKESGDEE
jgi:small subunit ribosomal protein S2